MVTKFDARKAGRRVVNGSSHCKEGGGSRGQHEPVYGKQQEIYTDPDTGQRYQLLICRHCEGVMSATKIGSKR